MLGSVVCFIVYLILIPVIPGGKRLMRMDEDEEGMDTMVCEGGARGATYLDERYIAWGGCMVPWSCCNGCGWFLYH